VPVRAQVETAKVASRCRARMPALFPFAIDFAVTVGTVVGAARIGTGLDPLVAVIVLTRQALESQEQGMIVQRSAADEVTVLPGGHAARSVEASGQGETTVGIGQY